MRVSPTRTALRRAAAAVTAAAAIAVSLASCSETKNGTGSGGSIGSAGPTGATTATASSAGGHGNPPLSKSEFITKMDLVCSGVARQLDAIPKPSSADDFTALNTLAKATLNLFPPYIATARSMAARTADSAELSGKWLSIEESDFAQTQPLLSQLVDATQANDATKVHAIESQLQAVPDHSTTIAAFMTSYGLTDCAKLESS